MKIEFGAEEEASLQTLVSSGRFANAEDAVRAAVQVLIEDHPSWLAYVHEAIEEGINDADNGRLIPAETFFEELRARVKTAA